MGITLGIITALRQYSTLDYGVTFMAFLFFSLPIFWVAVLLKEFGAIGFNNFLRNPEIPLPVSLGIGAVLGAVAVIVAGGDARRRVLTGGIVFAAVAAVLVYFSVTQWFKTPGLGPVVIAIAGVGIAFAVTLLTAGLRNRKALQSALIAVGVGVVALLRDPAAAEPGHVPDDRAAGGCRSPRRHGHRLLHGRLRPRPVHARGGHHVLPRGLPHRCWTASCRPGPPTSTTAGSADGRSRPSAPARPNIEGDFWILGLDSFTHLILPTTALILISLAGYTRFTRASMLEIMNMDYIRTARAKGLSERTVVMRHAFRNALIPVATIVAFDIGGLIGGAVITETVFSVRGMGFLFLDGILHVDPNPVMGVFICVAITAMAFNLIADLAYSALDPRVRVKA